MDLAQRCGPIELILSDVDGVLTDGGVVLDNNGIETKAFFIRDGLGIKLWLRAGYRFGIVTSRTSHLVQVRADELGIDPVRQGVADKLPGVQTILGELRLKPEQVCYIGDDLPDLPVVQYVGLGVAVADGCEELRAVAHHTTSAAGGRGAVRELVETVLSAQQRWEGLIKRYYL